MRVPKTEKIHCNFYLHVSFSYIILTFIRKTYRKKNDENEEKTIANEIKCDLRFDSVCARHFFCTLTENLLSRIFRFHKSNERAKKKFSFNSICFVFFMYEYLVWRRFNAAFCVPLSISLIY